jgi:transposase
MYGLSLYYTQKFSQAYDLLVKEGMEQNPAAPKVAGKRGRTKQSKARLLLDRRNTHKEEYLRFTLDFSVPFDNNPAERDFRISKLKQKISGCFRSDSGAQAFATIQSFIQTINKHHSYMKMAIQSSRICGVPHYLTAARVKWKDYYSMVRG